jgi:hypothetical protein
MCVGSLACTIRPSGTRVTLKWQREAAQPVGSSQRVDSDEAAVAPALGTFTRQKRIAECALRQQVEDWFITIMAPS